MVAKIDLSHVVGRITSEHNKNIFCGEGWHSLINNLDAELVAIDSDYKILQIKEKFGGLRFYFMPSDESKRNIMLVIIDKYELLASKTCEVTGEPGVLMFYNGVYKTLSNVFARDGWRTVNVNPEE